MRRISGLFTVIVALVVLISSTLKRDPTARAILNANHEPLNTENINNLAEAVNSAAKREAINWTFLIAFGTYLAIAVASTTSRDMLYEAPLKLPILNVDLPLLSFYCVAPGIFVAVHFFVLVQNSLMFQKVQRFFEVARENSDDDPTIFLRHLDRLESYILCQFQVNRLRNAPLWPITTISYLTMIVLPITLLIITDLRLLPYHSLFVTYWHRLLIGVDVMVVFSLWRPAFSKIEKRVSIVLAATVLVFIYLIATIPGEASERLTELVDSAFIHITGPVNFLTEGDNGYMKVQLSPIAGLRSLLFDGVYDITVGRSRFLLTRRLIVEPESINRSSEYSKSPVMRYNLRNRDFQYAWLEEVDLRGADLSFANLYRADMAGADLRGSSLFQANLSVRPRSLAFLTDSSNHQPDGCPAQESERVGIEVLPILCEPAASVEPSEGPLDDPALGQNDKLRGCVRPLDDLDTDLTADALEALLELRALVAAIGVKLDQEWMEPKHRAHQQHTAVAILHVGCMDKGKQQQTLRVYRDMALLALDLLACIVTVRID